MDVASCFKGFFDFNTRDLHPRTEITIGCAAGLGLLSIAWLSKSSWFPKTREQKKATFIFSSVMAVIVPLLVGVSAVVKGKSWVSHKTVTLLPYATRLTLILDIFVLFIEALIALSKRVFKGGINSPGR